MKFEKNSMLQYYTYKSDTSDQNLFLDLPWQNKRPSMCRKSEERDKSDMT